MLKRFASIFQQPAAAPQLSSVVHETDDTITIGANGFNAAFRDRYDYDRLSQLTESINMFRVNPLARRIVEVTTEFVIGDGFTVTSPSRRAEKVIKEFWNHPLNDLDSQLSEWADEAWRCGDLFILFSIDATGSAFVRAVPAEQINEIVTSPNDYRQELAYKRSSFDDAPWPAYKPGTDQTSFILHFPLNRMIGATFGESDLYAVKYWIKIYQDFIENRARINHYSQLFTYVLQRNYNSQAEKDSYVKSFARSLPRKSGGVIAIDNSEQLGAISPKLASYEASLDGITIKRMIALGAGLPMHYLAEPESSTSTTADAAGTPTFKRFKARQVYLRNALLNVLQTVLEIRRGYDSSLPTRPRIDINVPDITERDNSNLSMAAQRIVSTFVPLYNAKKISARELIRLVYKFLAETPPDSIEDETSPIVTKTNSAGGSPAAGPAIPPEPDPAAPKPTQEPK